MFEKNICNLISDRCLSIGKMPVYGLTETREIKAEKYSLKPTGLLGVYLDLLVLPFIYTYMVFK